MKGLYNFVLHSVRNLVTEEQLKKNAKYSGVLSIPSNILYHPKYHLKIKSYPERWENIKWYDGMMWCQYMYICIYVDIYIYIHIYIYRFTYKCLFHISFFILTNILVVLHNCRRLCKTTEIFLRIKIVFYLIWFLASDLFIYNMYYIYI